MRRIALVLLASPLLVLATGGCGRPAQIGGDRDSFKAVDALYTAVSLRDPAHLDRCETTLRDLRARGKLPDSAGRSLDAIVAEARGGRWEDAQARLGAFMRGQRR
jgi:hypothetical protein